MFSEEKANFMTVTLTQPMSFYVLDPAADHSASDSIAQVDLFSSYDPWQERSIWQIDYKGPIDFDLQVPEFVLKPGVKLHDILHSNHHQSHASLLISRRLYDHLRAFRLPAYQHYPTVVHDHQGYQHPYVFLYFHEAQDEHVDFSRTRFYLTVPADGGIQKLERSITSLDSYRKVEALFQEEDIGIQVLDLHLKEGIALDMLRMLHVPLPILFSQELVASVQSVGFTGLAAVPMTAYFKSIKERLVRMNWV